ncbi:ubiquitin-like-conjugating enzyme ATG10 [Leguminivora glycinivorella]|uniref:ubiquitin-like-conjugating enzyme ATG10 n=1 Tax=Leguminivora glycinivorella TaxID=1035111 RepID=UPI00200C8623|nr:ubiquitin-like-conjugating enzyme ATG10 [Leguminivora glycinivorella]
MSAISYQDFINAAEEFLKISQKINDGWQLSQIQEDKKKTYLKKESFKTCEGTAEDSALVKTEYVIFYNHSYCVPSFSFNVWNSTGCLLPLEKIRHMSFIRISEKDFYSVITQQEHPLFFRPYFMMHPCHTEELLLGLKNKSKNIIVTFLGLITPLIKLDLPLEYGL